MNPSALPADNDKHDIRITLIMPYGIEVSVKRKMTVFPLEESRHFLRKSVGYLYAVRHNY